MVKSSLDRGSTMISPYKVSNSFIAHFDMVIIQFYVF